MKKLILLTISLFIGTFLFSQEIENIRTKAVGKKIHVYYQIKNSFAKEKFDISLSCNVNGREHKISTTGDVGKIKGGQKEYEIICDVKAKEDTKMNIIFTIKIESKGGKRIRLVNGPEELFYSDYMKNLSKKTSNDENNNTNVTVNETTNENTSNEIKNEGLSNTVTIKNENRGQEDKTAPEISIVFPKITNEVFKTKGENLIITGKVTDESKIYQVIVANKQAEISDEGIFQATINLDYGINKVTIKATDEKYNISEMEIIIDRLAEKTENQGFTETEETVATEEEIIEEEILPNEIVWQTPEYDYTTTSEKLFKIQACINTSENLESINIYNNGELLEHGQLGNTSMCKFSLKEEINLSEGKNNLKIEVVTDKGKFEQEVVVEYDIITSKYYALIIGVSEYLDTDLNLAEPVNDAQKLYDILTTEYTFEKENITFLKSPTKAEIFATLENMRHSIGKNDNLLIFYAGHGSWDEEMEVGYWLPSDATKDNRVNWMSTADITNYIRVIPAKHTLLIADACFSGSIFRSRSINNNSKEVAQLYELPSRNAITSGTLKEVPDKSVFLKYLLEKLKENNDKYLSSEKLFSTMKTGVINNGDNIPQYGTIQKTGDEGGDFIFKKRTQK